MKKLVIAGGGTGGHIYPGLALAETLLRNKDWQVHFVGTSQGLESKILPQHIPLHFLPIQGWQGVSFLKKIKVCFLLPFALLKSFYLLLKLRPQYILGLGGYASGPLVLMGRLMGFRTSLWEMNAYPGLTNRILSRYVHECWVVFENSRSHLQSKQIHTAGLPVRKAIENLAKKTNKDVKNILIFGGSRGARGINRCVLEWLTGQPKNFRNLQVRLQTGHLEYSKIKTRLQGLSNVHVFEYLNDITQDYQWADLVICRAGASTLAELATTQKASILIPFPMPLKIINRRMQRPLLLNELVL